MGVAESPTIIADSDIGIICVAHPTAYGVAAAILKMRKRWRMKLRMARLDI